MVLVDTSSWIHMLRNTGDLGVRHRVNVALRSGEACWCPMVRLELWNGARGQREKRVLREFDGALTALPIDNDVWEVACDLAREARSRGVTIPATDLLIFACARRHGAVLESADSDFGRLAQLGETVV